MRTILKLLAAFIMLATVSACQINNGRNSKSTSIFPVAGVERLHKSWGDKISSYERRYYSLAFYDEDGIRSGNFDSAGVLMDIRRYYHANNYPFFQDDVVLLRGRQTGYYDKNGQYLFGVEEVLKLTEGYEYFTLTNFSEGIAFAIDNGRVVQRNYAFNKKGELLYETPFEVCSAFRDGYAFFQYDDLTGIMNKDGEVIVKPSKEVAYDIVPPVDNTYSVRKGFGSYGLKDFSGNLLIDYISESSLRLDDNGLAIYYDNNRYGLVRKDGQIITEAKYVELEQDGDLYWFLDQNMNIGWCDTNGNEVIAPIRRGRKYDPNYFYGPFPFYGSKYSFMYWKHPDNPDIWATYLFTREELEKGVERPERIYSNVIMITPFHNGKAIVKSTISNSYVIADEKAALDQLDFNNGFRIILEHDDYPELGRYLTDPDYFWD